MSIGSEGDHTGALEGRRMPLFTLVVQQTLILKRGSHILAIVLPIR
jgi:hypothetical protein